MKLGSKGSDVAQLQTILAKIIPGGCSVDGEFGPTTQRAVMKFQDASGLQVDGVVGQATQDKLPHQAQDKALSANFNEPEFACKHCGLVHIEPGLIVKLQALRTAVGKPVTINSAYRCPSHNKNISGAPRSKHMLGQAVDIQVNGMTPKQVALVATKVGLLGIGTYPTFTHVDLGPKRAWKG